LVARGHNVLERNLEELGLVANRNLPSFAELRTLMPIYAIENYPEGQIAISSFG
jgi:hypothetical protein